MVEHDMERPTDHVLSVEATESRAEKIDLQ